MALPLTAYALGWAPTTRPIHLFAVPHHPYQTDVSNRPATIYGTSVETKIARSLGLCKRTMPT